MSAQKIVGQLFSKRIMTLKFKLADYEIIIQQMKLIKENTVQTNSLQKLKDIVEAVLSNFERRNVICFIYGLSPYRAVNTFHHGYLKTNHNLLYIWTQSVPRCKHFPTHL